MKTRNEEWRSGAAETIEYYRRATDEELFAAAEECCRRLHGEGVLLRGLLEIGNICSRDCLYCGIRAGNRGVRRYRLSEEQIKAAVRGGYARGLRTFVLQGGEDPGRSTAEICRLVSWIREYTGGEAAVTLSLGNRSRREYAEYRRAGAERYLLRFETADPQLHRRLRGGTTLEERLRALRELREQGYELGTGYMVGLPGETEETRVENARLTRELEADMVGIGPFIPHPQTPLAGSEQQPLRLTLRAIALVRLLLPRTHMPATTAAGSLDPQGRERCLAVGANVLMPNISPVEHKRDYLLYPGKICLDESGLECIGCLAGRAAGVGRRLDFSRGGALRRPTGDEHASASAPVPGTPRHSMTLQHRKGAKP